MQKLVLLRHGESVWNLENRFTGWTDVDLSPHGFDQAAQAGILLRNNGYTFDIGFTSVLKRSIKTLHIALDQMDHLWIPVRKSWRLNERFYGALQGLNKDETIAQYGEEQVHKWRRDPHERPPAITEQDERFPGHYLRYDDLTYRELPLTENLSETMTVVLHGVHTLLWVLEELAARHLPAFEVETLKASFLHWIYIGAAMSLHVDEEDGERLSVHVDVEELTVFKLEIAAGKPEPSTYRGRPNRAPRQLARALRMEELPLVEDEVCEPDFAVAHELFPHASRRYGAAAVAQIAAFSYVIGMEAPGLLSTSARYTVALKSRHDSPPSALHFRVEAADPRFRRVRLGIEGSALSATLEAFMRQPPVAQASMGLVQAAVLPGEFAAHASVSSWRLPWFGGDYRQVHCRRRRSCDNHLCVWCRGCGKRCAGNR